MKHLAALLFSSVALVAPAFLYAEDEYTFDLKNPPEYAKEAFAIVAQFEKAHVEGPSSGLLKVAREGRSYRDLEPKPGSPAVQLAAYRWGLLRVWLAYQPNFVYLEKVRTGSKDTKELFMAMKAWSHDDFSNTHGIGIWGLGVPDVDPKTPVAEVKKLHRYITRLAARMLRRVKDTYDPDFRKTFYMSPDDIPRDLRYGSRLTRPTETELAQNMRDLCNYRWRQEMFRIHNSLGSVLWFLKSDLCVIFRTHMPGDKALIKEMLAEAGFKTAEERKAFWQHCRTEGATWSMWTEADEARLVTD